MDIKPIVRVSITDQVFEQLKEQILSGVWRAGEKLPSETDLATLFSVSRVTVRQALQKLAVSGLIETKLGEGSFVKEMSLGIYMNSMIPLVRLDRKMLLEVLEYRFVVEVKTAGICAQRANESDVDRLNAIYQAMQNAKDDLTIFSEADLNFHVEIANITKNSLIIETHKIIRNILSVAMQDIVEKRGSEKGLYYHQKLLSAIKNKNPQEAMAIMETHLQDTYHAIEEETNWNANS